jgi:hypothetical protein
VPERWPTDATETTRAGALFTRRSVSSVVNRK